MMCEDNKNEDEKYKVYLEERAKLIQFQAEETHKFDKAILTLAGGAFGFSLAFIKESSPALGQERTSGCWPRGLASA